MGIKNIHIGLIFCSAIIAVVFGFWGLNNNYAALGGVSFVLAVALVIYGINFIKKTKANV